MWIRSQNKKVLGKFDFININHNNPLQLLGWNNSIVDGHGSDSSIVLGIYESEAEAIKVLDTIEGSIINAANGYAPATVYHMPEADFDSNFPCDICGNKVPIKTYHSNDGVCDLCKEGF